MSGINVEINLCFSRYPVSDVLPRFITVVQCLLPFMYVQELTPLIWTHIGSVMSSYHPYLTDDSSDDSLMEEVSNRPQIAIKYAKSKPLKSTTKVAEESDVEPEELVDQELVRKLIDAYTEVRAEYDAEVEEHAEVSGNLQIHEYGHKMVTTWTSLAKNFRPLL